MRYLRNVRFAYGRFSAVFDKWDNLTIVTVCVFFAGSLLQGSTLNHSEKHSVFLLGENPLQRGSKTILKASARFTVHPLPLET